MQSPCIKVKKEKSKSFRDWLVGSNVLQKSSLCPPSSCVPYRVVLYRGPVDDNIFICLRDTKILQNQSCNFCLLQQPWKGYLGACGTCDMWLVRGRNVCGKSPNPGGREKPNWEAAIKLPAWQSPVHLTEADSLMLLPVSGHASQFRRVREGKLTAAEVFR